MFLIYRFDLWPTERYLYNMQLADCNVQHIRPACGEDGGICLQERLFGHRPVD